MTSEYHILLLKVSNQCPWRAIHRRRVRTGKSTFSLRTLLWPPSSLPYMQPSPTSRASVRTLSCVNMVCGSHTLSHTHLHMRGCDSTAKTLALSILKTHLSFRRRNDSDGTMVFMEEDAGEPLVHDRQESGPRFLAVNVFYRLNIKRGLQNMEEVHSKTLKQMSNCAR